MWLFAFWWCRPAQSRLVVFFLSRRLFGERPRVGDLWRCALRGLHPARWARLTWGRLSPWLPVAMPVEELEELTGDALRKRRGLVVNRAFGAAIRLSILTVLLVPWVAMALIAMGMVILPQGQSDAWQVRWEVWQASDAILPPLMIGWTFAVEESLLSHELYFGLPECQTQETIAPPNILPQRRLGYPLRPRQDAPKVPAAKVSGEGAQSRGGIPRRATQRGNQFRRHTAEYCPGKRTRHRRASEQFESGRVRYLTS